MAFFNKRMILLFTNLFLLAGIGTTIANYSTSVIQGEAINAISSIYKSTSVAHTLSIPDGLLSEGSGNSNITITNKNDTNISVSFAKNGGSDDKIFNNSSGQIRLYASRTNGNGGSLTFSIGANYLFYSVSVTIATNANADGKISVDGTTSSLATSPITKTLNNGLGQNSIVIKNAQNSGTSNVRIDLVSIDLNYYSTSEFSAMNYSENILISTENKVNCTSDSGWSALESDYNALTVGAQNEFKTNSTNQTIIDARARYNYLISFNNTLNDFVFGV